MIVFEQGGYSGGSFAGSLLALFDPTLYIMTLFLHESFSSYIGAMYFFIPAGVALTYMTNNRNVLGIAAVSHVSAVFVFAVSFEMNFMGTMAAAYGLLSATMVRATKFGTEKYSKKTQRAAPMGVLMVATLGLLMLISTTTGGVQYIPILVAFVFGGSFEATRIYIRTKRAESDEDGDVYSPTAKSATGQEKDWNDWN